MIGSGDFDGRRGLWPELTCSGHSASDTCVSKIIWDHHRADVDQLTNLRAMTDWQTTIDKDVDTAVDLITPTRVDTAKTTIPTSHQVRPNDKPWINRHLTLMARKRDRLFKQAKHVQKEHKDTNHPNVKHAWEKWRIFRHQLTNETQYLKIN